jgi:hypothetical protein
MKVTEVIPGMRDAVHLTRKRQNRTVMRKSSTSLFRGYSIRISAGLSSILTKIFPAFTLSCDVIFSSRPRLSPYPLIINHHLPKSLDAPLNNPKFEQIKDNLMGGAYSTHKRWETHTGFWSENLKESDNFEDVDVDGRIILEWILGKQGKKVWTGFIWLRIGTSGALLRTRQWTFGFHKRWGISWLAEWLSASQEGLCSRELVISLGSDLPENTPHPSYKDQSVYV